MSKFILLTKVGTDFAESCVFVVFIIFFGTANPEQRQVFTSKTAALFSFWEIMSISAGSSNWQK